MKSLPLDLESPTLKPSMLVTFVRMDGVVKRFCGAQDDIQIGNVGSADALFTSVPGVMISAIKHAIGGDPQQCEITVSHSDGGFFDTGDIDNRLYSGADVEISICDRDDLSTLGLYFTGTIEGIGYTIQGEATFDIRGQSVRSAAFVQKYHPMCRTDLFSSLCTLNQADFDSLYEVVTITDRHTAILNGASPQDDGYFNDGMAQNDAGFAFVIASWIQSTQTITTYQPICETMLSPGMQLTMWPGCDKRILTCFNKFNNAANFQGEPHFLGAAAVNA